MNAHYYAERGKFLEHVRGIARYWATRPGISPAAAADGVAFSILVALDGEACACGPYAVRAKDEDGNEGGDIGGELHEIFAKTMTLCPSSQ